MFEFIQVITILFFSVVCHEIAHGWVALRLGDPTAKLAGRLSLNPLKHIDPVGTIVVPVVLRLMSSNFIFGWAKPVPINYFFLRRPKRDMVLVSLAGPGTNFILALIFGIFIKLPLPIEIHSLFLFGVMINLVLMIFNLIPIPPLDGSKILMGALPDSAVRSYSKLEPYGFIILLVLMNLGLLNYLFFVVEFMAKLII